MTGPKNTEVSPASPPSARLIGSARPTVCPQCGESIIQERDGTDHCEECGWPSDSADPTKPNWRCFHCDEVFVDQVTARDHFGPSPCAEPACHIDASRLRSLEAELARYRAEDTDLHRQIALVSGEHQTALMRAEEAGYAKGLRDGKAPTGSATNTCEDCGSHRPMGNGLATALPMGYFVVKLWCERCHAKTWSLPFMPNP